MIEPLRYHIEKNPPHAIKKAVFCERCVNNKKLRNNPQLATKYCSQCVRFNYLCKSCEDYLHSFVKTKDHVRLIVVIGPAVRKKIIRRGNAKSFPKLFDIVEVRFKTTVISDGKVTHKEPPQMLKFPSGVSGTCIHIQILGGKKLPISDAHGTSDPFVCVSYAGTKLGTTRTRPRTINPRWTNETYVIPVDDNTVSNFPTKKRSKQRDLIKLEVFDRDYWNFNDFLGHVELTRQQLLKLADHSNSKPIRLNLTLREYHGCLGVKAGISADIFNLQIVGAEDLDKMDAVGLSDPYCVVYFRGKIVGKTPRIDNTLHPNWTTGNVFSFPLVDILKEERRLRMLAVHGVTGMGPTTRDLLDKSYMFFIQMYDHNYLRPDGHLGTVRITVDQLRKLCPHLPNSEDEIRAGNSLAHTMFKTRRMSTAGGVAQRLRNSISVAAGSFPLAARKTSSVGLASNQSSASNVAESSISSGDGLSGNSSYDNQQSTLDRVEEDSHENSSLGTCASNSVDTRPQHNNQLDDGASIPSNVSAGENIKTENDDMGDDFGNDDDGSVYRRPKSPAFDVNSEDEIEEDTFDALHPRENEAVPLLGMSRNRAMTKLNLRNVKRPQSENIDDPISEDLTDEEDEDEEREVFEGDAPATISHSEKVRLEEEEEHRSDVYHTDEKFFADRKLERLSSALDANALLAEDSDEDNDSNDDERSQVTKKSNAQIANVYEGDEERSLAGRSNVSGVPIESKSKKNDIENDSNNEDEDDNSDNENNDNGESDSDSDSEESGVYEEREASEKESRSGSVFGSVRSALQHTMARTKSFNLRENIRKKRDSIAYTLKGPEFEYGPVKYYDVQKDADQNVTEVEGDDRGQLILRLIKASRGHVIRGLDVGVSHMTLGETSQLKIRYDYGYGNFWMGARIPPRSNLKIVCKLVSINGGSGLKVWRQWLRFYRMFRRAARETRTAIKIGCSSCFAVIGLLREKYRLYKHPPDESESEDDDESSEAESSVSSESSVSEEEVENDPYYAKVNITDENRILYAGARVLWNYQPNKKKFIPFDPVKRKERQLREAKLKEKMERKAAKEALREQKRIRRLKKDGLISSSESEDEGDVGDDDDNEDEGKEDSTEDKKSLVSKNSQSQMSISESQAQEKLLNDQSQGEDVGDMSLRSHNEMMIEEGSQGQEGLSKRSLGSRAGSGASLKGEDDNASGISGLMSKDESGISGLISKDESDVVTKTKDD